MSDTTSTTTVSLSENLSRLQALSFRIGFGGFALLAIGFLIDRDQLHQAYLTGFLYWLGPAVGSMAIVMLLLVMSAYVIDGSREWMKRNEKAPA